MSTEPPTVRWHTREDSGLRLDRALRWWHDGEPLEHPNIVEAFNQGLRAMPDGRVQLVFGGDWCFVEVEDCAFAVLAVDEVDDALVLRLSDRTAEPLDPRGLAVDPHEGFLTAKVKGGLAKARFTRPAHFQLADRLSLEGEVVWVTVGARRQATALSPSALGEAG